MARVGAHCWKFRRTDELSNWLVVVLFPRNVNRSVVSIQIDAQVGMIADWRVELRILGSGGS